MTEPLTVAAPSTANHTEPATAPGADLSTLTHAESTAAQLCDVRGQLAAAQADLADARDELEAARKLREIRESEYTEFKDRVARTAMAYARRHDWCSVVTDALDDLGLQPPDVRVAGEFTVTYRFGGTIAHHRSDGLDSEWIANSIRHGHDSGPSFDSDWSDVDIDVESTTVDYFDIDDEED